MDRSAQEASNFYVNSFNLKLSVSVSSGHRNRSNTPRKSIFSQTETKIQKGVTQGSGNTNKGKFLIST